MLTFLAQQWLEVLFGLISAGLLFTLKMLQKRNKEFKQYKEKDKRKEYREMILSEIQPLQEEIQRVKDKSNQNFALYLTSFKYKITQICKSHLEDGYISAEDFNTLTEQYNIYYELGGNGMAQDYYERVSNLPIKNK